VLPLERDDELDAATIVGGRAHPPALLCVHGAPRAEAHACRRTGVARHEHAAEVAVEVDPLRIEGSLGSGRHDLVEAQHAFGLLFGEAADQVPAACLEDHVIRLDVQPPELAVLLHVVHVQHAVLVEPAAHGPHHVAVG
jgi:hypothetical protein